MKFLPLLKTCATRLAVLLAVVAATSAARHFPVDREVLDGSATVLGRAGVAELALAYGLKGEAQANIKSAIDTTDQLKSHASKFGISDPLLFGRLSYKVGAVADECFIPLLHGAFSTPLLAEKLLKSSASGAELTDATIARAHVFIDLTELKKDLLKAEEALKSGRSDQAVAALNDITVNALTLVEPGVDAGATLPDAGENLLLAQQFLRNRDFKAAGFAVDHAREALLAAAKNDPALQPRAAETAKTARGLGELADNIRSGKIASQKSPETAAADLSRQLDGFASKH